MIEMPATPEPPAAAAAPRTIRLTLAYDGTDFAGWQLQPGQRTIQGTVQDALRRILDEPLAAVVGAGRTDSGTHAVAQVAHVRTRSRLPLDKLRAGLNSLLPPDVRICRLAEAEPRFHARFSATAKEYRYHVWHGEPVPPFLRRYCYGVFSRLDAGAFVEAARLFEGTHDLSSFRAAHCAAKSPVRTVHASLAAAHGPMLVYAIRARGFLQHMVRIIAGTLVRVGRGELRVDDVPELIAARDRRRAPPTAPAQGLFLVRVEYPDADGLLEARPDPVLTFSLPIT